MSRADVWRKHLIPGDVHDKRKLYRNIIQQFPYTIPNKASVEIARDVPRTSDHVDEEVLETLLHQYVQILPCDGYLQGFNYIVNTLYHVFSKDDQEHAMADTWWAATTVIGIIRPMIPDHDPDDYARYTQKWGKHYIKHIQKNSPRTHAWLTPFYASILPTITVKWLMIWFTQMFDLDNCLVIWDALVTCEPQERTKLMAIIAANITIQHSDSIETWSREAPSEIGPRLLSVKAKDAGVIIDVCRDYMVRYTMPF